MSLAPVPDDTDAPNEPDEAAPQGRIPPHSADAEESLIGAMLLYRGAAEAGLSLVRADDFYLPNMARIFVAIDELTRAGQPVDVTTVAAQLAGTEPEISRRQLSEILAATPASANAPGYARIVIETSARRRLARAGSDIGRLAFDTSTDAAGAVERAHDLIDRADIPLGGSPAATVGEFLSITDEYKWTWPGILEESERLLIVAPEKFGKSTLIRQIAVLLAQGVDPFRLTAVPMVRVLMIDLENPPSLVRRKVGAIYGAANTLEHPAIADSLRIECRPEGINIAERVDLLWLHEKIAASKRAWERLGWGDQIPMVLCIGPVYKLHEDELDLREVKKVCHALDVIRNRYRCALIMETHAPHESFAAKAPPKSLRPAGPRLWLRWPEFCRAIEPSTGIKVPEVGPNPYAEFYDCQGARDERDWPRHLVRGGKYPWLEDQAY